METKNNVKPVVLFNGTVATTNGIYCIEDLKAEKAKEYIMECGFTSAIGHEGTAKVLSDLLDYDVKVNRVQYHQSVGQIGIALKLNERPPEGNILNVHEMKNIGYTLKLVKRLK